MTAEVTLRVEIETEVVDGVVAGVDPMPVEADNLVEDHADLGK